MSDATKVTLSDGELALANDSNIILTKLTVTKKASALFAGMVPFINTAFASLALHYNYIGGTVPKIYKGENYKNLPYVLMDYPAEFKKENIFAVRTMFWWGNFISITLHLSGKHKTNWENNILEKLEIQPDFFIAVGNDEWQHHFEEDNYAKFSLLTQLQKKSISEKNFIKIALKYELHHWNMMQSILPVGYKAIADLLIS
jgi:hypothetical protein